VSRLGPGDRPADRARDLATFLVGRYADAGWSTHRPLRWMSGLLHELGITSPTSWPPRSATSTATRSRPRMAYKYPAGAVRRLDDDLLALYGERYVTLPGNADRAGLLASRLAKMTP
jgi:hypothetical protein